MLLALNIGNTNITFGSFASDGRLAFVSRLYADPALSSDEICYKIINMLDLYGASPLDIEGVILGSVVPSITGRMREALRKMTQAPVLEVGPGLRSGVRIRMDNPAQLGAELLCANGRRFAPAHPAAACHPYGYRRDDAGRGCRGKPGWRGDFARAAGFPARTCGKHSPAAPG